MSQRSVAHLTDWALWFAENKDRERDNAKEHEFLKRALDELGGCVADLLRDLRALEGAPSDSMAPSLIWAPTGVRATNRARFGE